MYNNEWEKNIFVKRKELWAQWKDKFDCLDTNSVTWNYNETERDATQPKDPRRKKPWSSDSRYYANSWS